MKNYLEKLTTKEQEEILKVIKREMVSIKQMGLNASVWNNAISNVIDKLFGNK